MFHRYLVVIFVVGRMMIKNNLKFIPNNTFADTSLQSL